MVHNNFNLPSSSFSGSCSRSALFDMFRAEAFTERLGRESHCCYGNGEHVSGGWGALWQKTRSDLTTPATIGPELHANEFWHHNIRTVSCTLDCVLSLCLSALSTCSNGFIHSGQRTHADMTEELKWKWGQHLQIPLELSSVLCVSNGKSKVQHSSNHSQSNMQRLDVPFSFTFISLRWIYWIIIFVSHLSDNVNKLKTLKCLSVFWGCPKNVFSLINDEKSSKFSRSRSWKKQVLRHFIAILSVKQLNSNLFELQNARVQHSSYYNKIACHCFSIFD